MDMFEKIKSMNRDDLARFIWETYHAGNVDARDGHEDSPDFDSAYGGSLLRYDSDKYRKLWDECYGVR